MTSMSNLDLVVIPLNDQALEVLRTLPRHVESLYVFCDQHGRPYQRIVKGFREACKRANISDFRFHDLRHTFASHLVMHGVPLRTVQELLGHKTGQMTLRYTHLSTPHLQEAVTILETALIPTSGAQLEELQK